MYLNYFFGYPLDVNICRSVVTIWNPCNGYLYRSMNTTTKAFVSGKKEKEEDKKRNLN